MATQTKQQQYRAVSAGIALGLLMNGRTQVPNDKIKVELALASAWRKWSHRSVLPTADRTISGALKDKDLLWILTDLDKDKKQPFVPFHWDPYMQGGPTVVVRHAADFDPNNVDDQTFYACNINEEIPALAWKALAQGFIERLA